MIDVLVTGGAGFIGSHLCKTLAATGRYKVTSLDNYSTGKHSRHVNGVKYIEGNTADIDSLIKCKPQKIYHLGEYSRVEKSFYDFENVCESNVTGTLNVLKFAKKCDSKLIYAGSSTKFADDGAGPAQSPYGWTKERNTGLIKNFSSWFGLNYAIAYFYNAYGPSELSTGPYATVIGIFAECYKAGRSLPIVSPGTQKRNFTHVTDIASALLLIGEKGVGDGYGIGNPKSYSIISVAKLFCNSHEMLPPRRGNRMDAPLVCEKTIQLGWQPRYELEDYIESLKVGENKNE